MAFTHRKQKKISIYFSNCFSIKIDDETTFSFLRARNAPFLEILGNIGVSIEKKNENREKKAFQSL